MMNNNSGVYGINKAGVIKRIAAACLDFIIFTLVAVGFTTLVSFVFQYDTYKEALEQKYEEYNVIFEYDPTTGEKIEGGIFCEIKEEGDACYVGWDKFYKDDEAVNLLNTCTSITLAAGSIGLFAGSFFAYFLLPLLLKNGQTFGKKFMRLALINRNGVKVQTINLFIRFLFGIFVVELMLPFYCILFIFSGSSLSIFALVLVLAILISNSILIVSHSGCLIHDLIGKTVVVEYDAQAFFDTEEELKKYQENERKKNLEYSKRKGY